MVAEGLLRHKNLRIVTNNLNVATLSCSNPSFEVNIVGGRLRNDDRDILGHGMGEFFSSYMVDIGIFGCAGVGEDGTLLDFHDDEVRARNLIRQNSRETFLVLDHSKFRRTAHVRGGYIGDVTKIFCDAPPPVKVTDILSNSAAELVICNEEQVA